MANLYQVYDIRDHKKGKEVNVREILEKFEAKHGKPPIELIVNQFDSESIPIATTATWVLPFHIFLGVEENET